MRISDWSSDVCSSDLLHVRGLGELRARRLHRPGGFLELGLVRPDHRQRGRLDAGGGVAGVEFRTARSSEERRVGKEGVPPCKSRWAPSHEKKKTNRRMHHLNKSTTKTQSTPQH